MYIKGHIYTYLGNYEVFVMCVCVYIVEHVSFTTGMVFPDPHTYKIMCGVALSSVASRGNSFQTSAE